MSKSEVNEYFKDVVIKPQLLSLKLKNRNINYALIHSGNKPLVVFVHGAPGSWSAFKGFLKNRELQKHVNMLAIDRPGHGYSDLGKEETSLVEQAYYLSEVIRKHQVNLQKTILVGHSLGAPIIARLAMDYPTLTDGLILVGGSIDPAMEAEEWYRPLGSNFIGKIVLPKSFWVTNEEICFLKNELEQMLPLWKNLQIPITMIHGQDDKLVPKENVFFAQKMIQKEWLDVWLEDDVNHFIPWNHSELINKAIFKHAVENDWRK